MPLARFAENDVLSAVGTIERFGSTYFFTDWTFEGESGRIEARLMSTFTKRASEESNTGLLKGAPVIRADCAIPQLTAQPDFAVGFREHRTANERAEDCSRDCTLSPPTDINGVGLLYFAAYPLIADVCEGQAHENPVDRHLGRSVIARDVFYSANCDRHDGIVYRRHPGGGDRLESTLSRLSDGKMMAFLATEYESA